MYKQLLSSKSKGTNVKAGEDCPLPREALTFYRGGRGWGVLLRTRRGFARLALPARLFGRPTVRDSIHRDREKGLRGSRHAVFADGRSGSRDISM